MNLYWGWGHEEDEGEDSASDWWVQDFRCHPGPCPCVGIGWPASLAGAGMRHEGGRRGESSRGKQRIMTSECPVEFVLAPFVTSGGGVACSSLAVASGLNPPGRIF